MPSVVEIIFLTILVWMHLVCFSCSNMSLAPKVYHKAAGFTTRQPKVHWISVELVLMDEAVVLVWMVLFLISCECPSVAFVPQRFET